MRRTAAAILSLSFLICYGCQKTDKTPDTRLSEQDAAGFSEIRETCGDTIFAAVFYIQPTGRLFENDGFWAGQPVHAFPEYLSSDQKREISGHIESLLQADGPSAAELSKTLRNWCAIHFVFEDFQRTASIEVLFVTLAEEPVIKEYMGGYSERFKQIAEEQGTELAVSTFASAQIHDLYGKIITKIAGPGFIGFEQVTELLTSSQKRSEK